MLAWRNVGITGGVPIVCDVLSMHRRLQSSDRCAGRRGGTLVRQVECPVVCAVFSMSGWLQSYDRGVGRHGGTLA
jgi:hypothetical protein